MTDETDETADELTHIGPKTVVRTDDDRPTNSEMEQKEDETDKEFFNRMEKDSRGDRFDKVYLHESGWVKCVIERQDDYDPSGHEEWCPPHQVEVIY